ncbi:MAG: HlyD family secretion protein, partial [Gammaproteobacteria bacterium]
MSCRISKKALSMGLSLVVLTTAGLGYWWWAIQPFETTDNAYLKAHIGLISPKETGYVSEVLFKDNQNVVPGELLVLIEDHDFRAKVAEAEAEVQATAARIQTLESQKRTQLAKIKQEIAKTDA